MKYTENDLLKFLEQRVGVSSKNKNFEGILIIAQNGQAVFTELNSKTPSSTPIYIMIPIVEIDGIIKY